MIHKLMLLPQQPLKVTDLRSDTLYCVQPKFDGIRCAFDPATSLPYTRTGKQIPNTWLRWALKDTYDSSPWKGLALDGELQLWNPLTKWWDPYDAVQSIVMSKREPSLYEKQAWRYIIFDYIPCNTALKYLERLQTLESYERTYMNRFEICNYTMLAFANEKADVLDTFERAGYEGAIVRNVNAPYKHGRATYKEHIIFKHVTWLRSEATIVGVEEMIANLDTGCKKQDNALPMSTLGALLVESKEFGRFAIGSGFSEAQRQNLWNRWTELPGQLVTYKYRPGHLKDKPCPAIFVGLRSREDL